MTERFGPLVERLLDGGVFLEESVELLERAMIEGALTRAEGNQSAASKVLGIHRNTIQRKMAEYQLARVRRKPMGRVSAQQSVLNRTKRAKLTDSL